MMSTVTSLTTDEQLDLDYSLMSAHSSSNMKQVDDIIEKCQDKSYALQNSIFHASSIGNFEYLKQTLSSTQIDASWRNAVRFGHTPIHKAAFNGQEKVLELLIQKGASVNIKNNEGKTPLDLANKQTCVDILQAAMSRQPEPLKVKPSENMSVQEQDDIVENSKKPNQIAEDDKSTVTKKQEGPDAPITPEVEASLIEAIKEGYGDINLALILLHGAPAVGKSSLHRLLQGLPPLQKSQQFSTELFQNPVRLIYTGQLTLTGKNVLERVDERKVMRMIAAQMTRHKKKSTSEITPLTKITKPLSPLPVASNKTSSSGKVSTDTVVVSDVVKGIAAELSKVNTHTADLFSHRLFHIVDSGGQPQFTDVLPLMFPKVSLHIVVIRLDEKLDDKPKIRYLVAGEDKYVLPENLALSHLQMIERTCELAQAAATKNQKDKPPRVVVVGTCLDCVCPEESLLQKNHRLEEVFERYKHIIVRKSSQEVIFAMNAMVPEGEERNEYTCVLQNVLFNAPPVHTSDVKVPTRWMLLHLELSRLSEEGLLEMSSCIAVADRIQMCNDLPNALDYFTKVALHMRFPKKLPKLVFTEVNPIVSRLSTVLAATFTLPEFDPIEEERENLRVNGIVTKAFVHKLFDGKFKQNPFSVDDFFSLLEYLRIAVKIDDSKDFIPCVLPLDDPNLANLPNKSDPILLTWNGKVLPQGFFPALIVQLLQRKVAPCFSHCAGEKQLRRAVWLNSQYGALRLVDQTSWFELYFAGKMQYSQIMLQAVEDSSRVLTDVLNIHSFGVLIRAFHCTGVCGSKHPVHPALLTDTNEGQCTKREIYRFALSSQQMHWISSSVEHCQTAGEDHQLTDADLHVVLESTVEVVDWHNLGIQLRIPPRELEKIKKDHKDVSDCSRVMLHYWLNTGKASWTTLVAALKSPVINLTRIAEKIAFEHHVNPTGQISKHVVEDDNDILSETTKGFEDAKFAESHIKIDKDYRFSMKRPYEDIVESHKRRKEACVGQKRHQNENYDSQLSLKKPNLDIKTCKTVESTSKPIDHDEKDSLSKKHEVVLTDAPQLPFKKMQLTDLSIDQVIHLLDRIGLSEYKDIFIKEDITGSLLSEFNEEILETELNIKSQIHRIKLMRIIQGRQSIDELFNSNQ